MTRPPGIPHPLALCALALAVATAASPLACARRADVALPHPAPTEREAGRTSDLRGYCEELTTGDNPYLGPSLRDRLRAVAAASAPREPDLEAELALTLAREELQHGDAQAAVEALEAALAAQPDRGGPWSIALLSALAVTHLKAGELANCTTVQGRYACVLPVDGASSHSDRRGALAAAAALERLLEMTPGDGGAMWLLNLAHMALGSYPEGVPEGMVADIAARSTGSMGRFDEIAPAAGIYRLGLAGGAVIEDFDGDGLLDIAASSWHPCEGVRLYRNGGGGRFDDVSSASGLSGQLGGLNLVQADYDGDGWMDLLVLRGGWLFDDGRMRLSLLRNRGGRFTDVTLAAGLGEPALPTQAAAWADYDRDGNLDLFVCTEPSSHAIGPDGEVVWGPSPARLYRSLGDGTFEDVAAGAGVTNERFCKGAAWGDYDDDGHLDLYVSNYGGPNRLYRALGDGTFRDVAPELGVDGPEGSFATWWWDHDNDGDLDIFVAGFDEDIAVYAARYFGGGHGGRAWPRLYRNDGAGGFEDVTAESGLGTPELAMGAGHGDLDGDGYPDIVLGTGSIDFEAIATNAAYRNVGGLAFEDVSVAAGLAHLQKGHGVAFGDLDNDGDQDLYVQTGGFYPGDAFADALYRNPGAGNRWVTLGLVGTRSDRSAIGARIAVEVEAGGGTRRTIYSHVGPSGSFGGSSLVQEMGLGDAVRIMRIDVRWPATGFTETFAGAPLDVHLRITEGEGEFEVLDRPALPLGPAPRGP